MSDMDSRKSTSEYVFIGVRAHRMEISPIWEIIQCGDVVVTKDASIENLANLFTKTIQLHVDKIGDRCDILWTWVQIRVYWELYAHMSKYLIII